MRVTLTAATAEDRQQIYRIRHQIYATELGQHAENSDGILSDGLDETNAYVVAKLGGKVVGFVSITSPTSETYSIDKYFAREVVPTEFDGGLYEIRLLTVLEPHRNRGLSLLLMVAALRWTESHGGTRIVGMGRREKLSLYRMMGLEITKHAIVSGSVTYDLMHATTDQLAARMTAFASVLARILQHCDWRLAFPVRKSSACFHGGAFFGAIGTTFQMLEKRDSVINADVLDAWFPPAPGVVQALSDHLSWLLRTSPPTNGEGMQRTIAERRGVLDKNILPGAGSSDLIFLAMPHWLDRQSRVLILNPSYGEYRHVLEEVVGCRVDRFDLDAKADFQIDLEALGRELDRDYDLVVLVNPNSPTGQHVPRSDLERLLQVPRNTRIWIDETYIDYVGASESLEQFAAASENVIVCKSMSKAYALSGCRAAYLCAGAHQLESLRVRTPPWAVSLLAQVAAVKALDDEPYYHDRMADTVKLRTALGACLEALGWKVFPSVANFLLCELPPLGMGARELIEGCREEGLFLRDPGSMGVESVDRMIRIAVKDSATNARMLQVIEAVLARGVGCGKIPAHSVASELPTSSGEGGL